MTDCKCSCARADLTDPQTDLLLQSGVIDELNGRLQHFLDRNVHGLMIVGPMINFGAAMWLARLHADRTVTIALIAIGFLCIPAAIYLITISAHKTARPGYIMAALRSVGSGHRRRLLDQLNTVSLRGQHIPLSRSDVQSAAKLITVAASMRYVAKEARKQQTARVQASLIDAFRQG